MAVIPVSELVGLHVVFYDGVCGLCNRTTRFISRRDPAARFRFAPLQGEFAKATLEPLGGQPTDLDTFYVVAHYGTDRQTLSQRSRAVLFVARQLGFPWRVVTVFGVLPTVLLDLGYRLMARVRYRVFGKYDTCPIPSAEHRARFLDL